MERIMLKNTLNLLILMLVFPLTSFATDFAGKRYEGIAKLKGQPLDFWTKLEFDDVDAEVNVGEVLNFLAKYSKSKVGNAENISFTAPGSKKTILKTTDGGESITGSLEINGKSYEVWLLRVSRKHKPVEMSDDELMSIVSSPEGYTCFAILERDEGIACATTELVLDEDGRFSIECDNSYMQDFFKNMKGKYGVEEGKITLTTDMGPSFSGEIFDEGTYIKIPIGTNRGMRMTFILIR